MIISSDDSDDGLLFMIMSYDFIFFEGVCIVGILVEDR